MQGRRARFRKPPPESAGKVFSLHPLLDLFSEKGGERFYGSMKKKKVKGKKKNFLKIFSKKTQYIVVFFLEISI